MALQPWRKGKVIRIENYTHNTKRFWIQIPELDRFDFAPGQFVTLDLNAGAVIPSLPGRMGLMFSNC